MNIYGYELKCTCSACPEQYDVFDRNEKQVGYLRLRHGHFYASVPDHGGKIVYTASPRGDGIFTDDERHMFLTEAVKAIHENTSNHQDAMSRLIQLKEEHKKLINLPSTECESLILAIENEIAEIIRANPLNQTTYIRMLLQVND